MLFRRNGGVPVELPFLAVEEADQRVWTDLANNPEGRTACGFEEAPAQPTFNPATEVAIWDADAEAWVVTALPPPPPPPPVPVPDVSDRQFFQALALLGMITQDEAKAAVAIGAIPAAFQTVIDAMPAGLRFSAEMKLMGATTFMRHDPVTDTVAQILGMSDEEVDGVFRLAATL